MADRDGWRLQWGRTREGAETASRASGEERRGQPLQWGRTREGAETQNGYALKRNPTRLQWGRTREGAETRWRGGVCRWRPCFNGAAPVKVRKQHDQRCGTWRDGAGFNGAAPVKVRKRSHAGLLTAAWASFNGAAPVKVRKPCPGGHCTRTPPTLQWGRTREGAETSWPV